MKTKNDASSKLTSLNSSDSLTITGLSATINNSGNITVFFISSVVSSYITFNASEPQDVILVNTLINHFSTPYDKVALLYYSGDIGAFTTDRISLMYIHADYLN